MKQINLTSILIVIILLLLIYLSFFRTSDNKPFTDQIDQQNQELTNKIEVMQDLIIEKMDSIKIIEKKEIYVRNYYNEVIEQIESISNDSIALSVVRNKLQKLGPGRIK